MEFLWRKLFVLFLMVVIIDEISCAMVCESQTKRHGGCARHVNEDIYTCTIPNIYSIVDVDVLRVRRPRGTSCTHHAGAIPDTYTTDMPGVYHFCGDQITVAGGCRAVFNVTFDVCVNENPPPCNGTIRRHGCSANYDTNLHECKIPNVFGEILNVSIFNMVSKDAACKYYPKGTLDTWTPEDGGAFSFTNTSVIMAGGCRAVVDLCLSDPPTGCEGRTMKHGGCARNAHDEYFNCTVPNVYSIIDLDIHQQTSQDANCTRMIDVPFDWNPAMGGVYGIAPDGYTIEVAGGCRAVFEVEFDVCVNDAPPDCEGGQWKRHPCTAIYTEDYNVCTVPNFGEIMYASIFNKISTADCVFYPPPIHTHWNSTFGGAYTFYGNTIYVAGGCRAVFDVCGSASQKCTVRGDPHITTFDGKHFSFRGLCSYVLLQHSGFSVIGENRQCYGRRSCLLSVDIHYAGQIIKLAHKHKLFVNGNEEDIPYTSASVEVTQTSPTRTVATITNGISVEWDGKNEAVMRVPDIYMELVEGMCGDFNLDPSDDFKTPSGDIAENHVDFGNSWKTDLNCPDV